MPSRLFPFFDRFGGIIQKDVYDQRAILRNFVLPEIERKRVTFPEFRRKLVFSWHQFKKKCEATPSDRGFTTFFRSKFPELYTYFLSKLFPFDPVRLRCVAKDFVTDDEILFEYKYMLTPEDMEDLEKFRLKYTHPEKAEKFISYVFDVLTTAFGILIHRFIDAKVYISQACGIVRGQQPNQSVQFLVSVRQDRRQIIEQYLAAELTRFTDNFPSIPAARKKDLSVAITKIYDIARQEYPLAEHALAGVIYHFYRRCSTLQFVTPLLDFFTYVGARAEDSKYSFSDILSQDFLPKFNYSEEKNAAISRLFNFLQNASTLFTTFQSNNKPEPRKQFELFLLYCQYYFQRGLGPLQETKDIIYFPELFKRAFSTAVNSGFVGSDTPARFLQFILSLYSIAQNPVAPRFIELIFHRPSHAMNEFFFESFARELNSQFYGQITGENIKLRARGEKLTFNMVIDLVCRFMFVIIQKIFLRKTPEDAVENFTDARSRYSGPRIAVNVLEAELFRDLPLSDSLWGIYLLSLRKDFVKRYFEREFKLQLDDSLFFNNNRIVRMEMIYAKGLEEGTPPLSEWLVNGVLVPFAQFENIIGATFGVKSEGAKDSLSHLQKYFSDNARDPEERRAFLDILDTLQMMWPSFIP